MARNYPRFLFSNPQNTKSKGPFIVHCLEPRIIFKIVFNKKEAENSKCHTWNAMCGLILLDDIHLSTQIHEIIKAAQKWFEIQSREDNIGFNSEDIFRCYQNWEDLWSKDN